FDLKQLLVLVAPHYSHVGNNDNEFIESCLKAMDEDPLPLLGRARNMLTNTNVFEAGTLLAQITEQHPEILTAHGLLGRVLSRFGTTEQLVEWDAKLPENAGENGDVWLTRGDLCLQNGFKKAAARCFWEGLKADSLHPECAFKLGHTLGEIDGYQEQGLIFQKYSRDLHSLVGLAANAGPLAPENMKAVVEKMLGFGRIWEAAGWCIAATALPSERGWATLELEKLSPKLRAEPPFILAKENPANDIDLSDWEVPSTGDYLIANRPEPPAVSEALNSVSFREEAGKSGIEFRFNNSKSQAARMFESSGGGASILDFDRDGWPDIYFPQGASWPVKAKQTSFRDAIYRNMGGESFEEIPADALFGDTKFSQSAAIGDVDGDGFDDVFVANIGPNTLFHNNGDGTFTPVELPGELAGDSWTIGAIIADLNGDTIPDIYALNYLSGDDVFTRTTPAMDNQNMLCSPVVFQPTPDQVLIGDGNGSFRIDSESGIAQSEKSTSLIYFRDATGKPSLYFNNDGTQNTLLSLGDEVLEQSLQRGAALGATGKPGFGHGIAAGDIDNDGTLDLFVTNTTAEHNSLFVQDESGKFADQISGSGLRELIYFETSWGAQFLDGNLDGTLDLFIANGGHEEIAGGPKSRQLPLYVHNLGDGRFLKAAGRTGRFFREERLARAATRFDWNRDGLPDLVVTERGDTQSLLTNTTDEFGDSIRLQLVGTTASRDAVGTIATLTTDSRTLTRQLTAGDGFQCSNQRQIVFGLGKDEEVKSVEISWSSVEKTTLSDIERNVDHVLLEGAETAVVLPQ
ncbi:MAG: FG-GAP-like repeat-containing protein, partial [Planctomycetaceae bacterium]